MMPMEHDPTVLGVSEKSELKILIAEDDPNLRIILNKQLAGKGQVRLAVDGTDAWKQFQEDPPHILLSDWMMPNMDGVELCRRVKAIPRFCYVIMMTNQDTLDDKVKALDDGVDDYLVKPVEPRELDARINAGARICRAQHSREAESLIDGLTGLKNRRAFEEALPLEMAKADRAGKPFCLVMGDVNRFKVINDQYGHQVGDKVLSAVGHVMTESLRKVDFLYRLGGDEFAAILPECPRLGGVNCLLRLKMAVEGLRVDEMPETVGISLGLSVFDPSAPVAMDVLIREADKEMYLSKRERKTALEGGTLQGSAL
jgi:two-component system chemotaxis response regulator CheY